MEKLTNIPEHKLDVLMKEYEFLRTEIDSRQKQRTDLMYVLLLSMGAVLVGAAQAKGYWLFYVLPPIALFLTLQVYESYRLHRIQKMRAIYIEEQVNLLLSEESLNKKTEKEDKYLWWEHFFDEKATKREISKYVRKWSYILIMWIAIGFSVAISIIFALAQQSIIPDVVLDEGLSRIVGIILNLVYVCSGIALTACFKIRL